MTYVREYRCSICYKVIRLPQDKETRRGVVAVIASAEEAISPSPHTATDDDDDIWDKFH